MKKAIVLFNELEHKYNEYKFFFEQFGIKVISYNFPESFNHENPIQSMKDMFNFINNEFSQKYEILSFMVEQTSLFNEDDEELRLKDLNDMDKVYTKTKLYLLDNSKFATIIESSKLNGFIDLNKPKVDNLFGWDNIFIVRKLGISLHELKEINAKNIGRQEIFSKISKMKLYYKDKVKLNIHNLDNQDVVNFTPELINFIKNNTYLNSENVKSKGLNNLFHYALTKGAFFRKFETRKQKNYWLPGLNAGIPITPKKDEIHELTFIVHDLCHFSIPDLIFDNNDELSRKTYIISRMMSEAFTLVLADMIFIDSIKNDFELEYDFSKRKIYPLYQALKKYNPDIELKDILYYNVMYCLLGDDSYYKDNISISDYSILEDFKEKYENFFIEDFKWTNSNFKNFANKKVNYETISKWSYQNQHYLNKQGLMLVSDLIQKLNLDNYLKNKDIVDKIFNYYYEEINILLNTDYTKLSNQYKMHCSFKNYLLGQMVIFYRYDFLQPISDKYRIKISSILNKNEISIDEIKKIRELYNSYLEILRDDYHLINNDDYVHYKNIYPLFKTNYAFYDNNEESRSLKKISQQILRG